MPFDHFSVVAGLYNRTAQFNPPSELLDILALDKTRFLLDAGGGTGRIANSLKELVRGVVVADLSRAMVFHAVKKGLQTVCAPAENLPFHSGLFDRIIMVDALHHVFDQQQTICELWRVCAPGGKVVIIEPDIQKVGVMCVALIEKILFMRSHFRNGREIALLFPRKFQKLRLFI